PSPRSYQGALRPQRPQRRETPLRGRTRATTSVSPSASSPSNSSTSMSSITVRWSTPSSARHNLTLRTSLPAPLVPDLRQARNLKRQRRAPFHINNAPTEVSEEPYFVHKSRTLVDPDSSLRRFTLIFDAARSTASLAREPLRSGPSARVRRPWAAIPLSNPDAFPSHHGPGRERSNVPETIQSALWCP